MLTRHMGVYIQFTAKQLNRQAVKAGKDETAEKNQLKKAMKQGNPDIARLYAENAIRKQNERLNLLRLASRIDAVASRVQTAVTMRQVTGSMTKVVKGMEGAMKSMNLEKVGPYLSELLSVQFGKRGGDRNFKTVADMYCADEGLSLGF